MSKCGANFRFKKSKVKVTGRRKPQESATYLAYMFTYERQRRRLRRRLQVRPNTLLGLIWILTSISATSFRFIPENLRDDVDNITKQTLERSSVKLSTFWRPCEWGISASADRQDRALHHGLCSVSQLQTEAWQIATNQTHNKTNKL